MTTFYLNADRHGKTLRASVTGDSATIHDEHNDQSSTVELDDVEQIINAQEHAPVQSPMDSSQVPDWASGDFVDEIQIPGELTGLVSQDGEVWFSNMSGVAPLSKMYRLRDELDDSGSVRVST